MRPSKYNVFEQMNAKDSDYDHFNSWFNVDVSMPTRNRNVWISAGTVNVPSQPGSSQFWISFYVYDQSSSVYEAQDLLITPDPKEITSKLETVLGPGTHAVWDAVWIWLWGRESVKHDTNPWRPED
jgi:hypothetical protein